jgi:hypothetical protein
MSITYLVTAGGKVPEECKDPCIQELKGAVEAVCRQHSSSLRKVADHDLSLTTGRSGNNETFVSVQAQCSVHEIAQLQRFCDAVREAVQRGLDKFRGSDFALDTVINPVGSGQRERKPSIEVGNQEIVTDAPPFFR